MVAPTGTDIWALSKVDFPTLGYADAAELDPIVAIGVASLIKITGIDLSTVPTDEEPLVTQAVRGLTEQTAYQSSPDIIETLSDWDLIQSFSAGPYSETRRSPADAFKARMLNAWPWLNSLLWNLLTSDRYDYWIQFFSGQNAPAVAVQEVDWSGGYEGYGGYSDPFGDYPAMWGSNG